MPTPRKVAMLAEIKDRMERASIAISADYRGLTVAQITELRRAMRPSGAEVKVVKNTLALRAAIAAGREEMAQTVEQIPVTVRPDGSLRVARSDLSGYDAESLRSLWPAIAAKVDVVMDRRGTQRLAEFTIKGNTGGSIQLSGGVEVRMSRDHLVLQRWDARRVEAIRNARLGMAKAGQQARPELS